MKRPRWLGGRVTTTEEDDGKPAAKSAKGRSESDAEALTAAERSARRTARKTLGDRVGKASQDTPARSDEPAGSKPERKVKPKPGGKPELKPKADGKDEERDRDTGKDEDEDGEKDDRGKELHRPRRQRDGEKRPAQGRRSRDGSPKSVKAGKSAKSVKSGESDKAGKAGKTGKAKRKPRIRGAVAGFGTALKSGAVETRKRIAVAAPKVGRRGLAILGAIFAIFFELLGFVLNVLIAAGRFVARPVGWVLVRLRRVTDAASRLLTPKRVLALVVAGAAVLLALSQYADYRSISIGNDAYSGVQNIAPPPETGRLPTGDAHSYIFVPIAILCLLSLAGALTGRWRLCRLITIAGVAAIVVAILVDRPAGLDAGDAAFAFDGVRATLLGGFYAQIAAGVLLIGSSSLLARELRLTGATESAGQPERARSRREGRRALRRPPDPDAGGVRA
jgi:hypothetical protein